MEDRMNAALLFVLLDGDAQQDLAQWEKRLRAIRGVSRVTFWDNSWVERTDWIGEWRQIKDDFKTLAVCEIDGPVESVKRPEGLRTILFRRAARPSQGVLRLPTKGLCIVICSPGDVNDDEDAQKLRDWGDFVHFPGIVSANIPGYGLVTPYENVDRSGPRFLHFYEFPEADAEAVFQRTRPALAQRYDSQPGEAAFEFWAFYPGMVLDYLGNFTRLGDIPEEVRYGPQRQLASSS